MGILKAIRRLESSNQFLTFDDGPDPFSTEKVLKVLQVEKTKATFFVVAEKALRQKSLIQQILAEGHAIGNHSLDHRYGCFFGPEEKLKDWILRSEDQIAHLIGQPTVGFRPPAGVRTPKLDRALFELKMPLILWENRFFDTVFPWTPARARRAARKAQGGSLVLLHDRQSPQKLPLFNEALTAYIRGARQIQIDFDKLSLELCRRAGTEQ